MAVSQDEMSVTWPNNVSPAQWLKDKPTSLWRDMFDRDGYLIVNDLLTKEELEIYQSTCSKMLSGEIDTSNHRHDLGNSEEKRTDAENICQILWPSLYVKNFDQGPVHERVLAISRCLLGDDTVFDHDMLMVKAPNTDTATPWHQDESYWPSVPDKRALMCWTALDGAYRENGCMWFVPGSHKGGVRKHRPVKEGCHVLTCDTTEGDKKMCAEIKAGSCTFHHGRTLHYTQGNSTEHMRRAIVTSFRPDAMLEAFLQAGHDHGKKGKNTVLRSGQTHGTFQSAGVEKIEN